MLRQCTGTGRRCAGGAAVPVPQCWPRAIGWQAVMRMRMHASPVAAACDAACRWSRPTATVLPLYCHCTATVLRCCLQVEQAYCQGSRGSFRLQVINGSVWIAEKAPSFESRLLNLKRQLLHLWLAGHLPEGIDVSRWGSDWHSCCCLLQPLLPAAAAAARCCLLQPLLPAAACCRLL